MKIQLRNKYPLTKYFKQIYSVTLFFVFIALLGVSCSEEEDSKTKTSPQETLPTEIRVGKDHSNMPNSGVISVQYHGTSVKTSIDRLIDNSPSTYYQVDKNQFYIIYQADQAVAINHYSVCAGESLDNAPSSWTLYASNDEAEWKALDEQNSQSYTTSYEFKEFVLPNQTAYLYYKLEIKGNAGGANTEIAEWTLAKKDVSSTPDEPHSAEINASNTNMPTAGILTAQYSDYPDGEKVGMLVDRDPKTRYTTAHNHFYLIWEGEDETLVNSYTITNSDSSNKNNPSSWIFSGSNDGEEWVELDRRTEQQFAGSCDRKLYLFENNTSYIYYRLEIQNNNGGELTQIGEWGIKSTDINDLIPLAVGWSNSDITPMGNHFENRHITTDEDRLWLLDPNNEPTESYGGTWQEFPVTLYPFGEPLPADVNQHAIGNCAALSVLGSLAYMYPDFIKSIIQENADKSYTIKMFDPLGKPIDVCISQKFTADNNRGLIGCTGKDNKVTWASVLEKAAMKWQSIYKVNPNLNGIGSEHFIPLFTGDGNSFGFRFGTLNAEQTERAVKVSLAQTRLITGGFNKNGIAAPDGSGKTVTAHSFTVTYSAHPTALFAMRNPWGVGYDADSSNRDGVLNIFNGIMVLSTDLRIMEPGAAANYVKEEAKYNPYIPPVFGKQAFNVSPKLLKLYNIN